MHITIAENSKQLGLAAGERAAHIIRHAIDKKGHAVILLATGSSQFETLAVLTKEKIDWSRVTMFHLDEYIGLPESSPASFRRYLKERFVDNVSPLKAVHYIDGDNDPVEECNRLNKIISSCNIDVALLGIGENGHLAFNDPPADFETTLSFLVVDLDEQCRMQQTGEGWFKTIDDVPTRAITMSIRQIMKSAEIVCSVPDSRKANAVKACLELPVSNLHPGSILQYHTNCTCYLDKSSAALLSVIETSKQSFDIGKIEINNVD